MPRISRVWSREILDSRGEPTVETAVRLENGVIGVASVPSGASTGKYEALDLRDNDEKRYFGKGVLKAVSNVNQKLGPALIGREASAQIDIDRFMISMDGTPNKSNMGANAILSISMAITKASALAAGKTLYAWSFEIAESMGVVADNLSSRVPTPLFNMINGGLHGAGNLDFQEFHVIPATSKPYPLSLQGGAEVYHSLKAALIRRGAIHSVGDEGGFAPNLFTNADALEIAVEAINTSGHQVGQDFFLGLDVAAGTFLRDGNYSIRDRSNPMNSSTMIAFYEEIYKQYRIVLLEDPLQEDDWDGWVDIMKRLGDKVLIVGDDLLATNPERVKKAIEMKACNAILVKPNQIGTVTETLEVIKMSKDAGWKIIVSHRSGETNDWFIADFAVGVKADFVKFGAPARGERVAKYNRLLSIEAELGVLKR